MIDRRGILRDGDVIVRRNNSTAIYFKGNLLDIKSPNVLLSTIDKYDEDLSNESEEFDILFIFRFSEGKLLEIFNRDKVIYIPISKLAEVYKTEPYMISIIDG